MRTMRRAGKAMAALAVAALLCCGCAGKGAETEDVQQDAAGEAGQTAGEESPEEAAPEESKEEALSVAEVYEKIGQAVELKSPACMDEEFISNYYGLDTKILEEYVFSISEDAAQAETVIIMKVKDAGDIEAVKGCLEEVVEEKKGEMEDYIPEQFAIVEKSEVVTKDNYVWLVISENEDSITSVIEDDLF